MFSFRKGRVISKFINGKYKKKYNLHIIEDTKEMNNDHLGNNVKFNSEMIPVPNIESEREIIYIAGPSGAGKSTLVSQYLLTWQKVFPKKDIYIFSRKSEDKVFKNIKKIKWVPIDKELVDNPIDIIKDVDEGSCIVFDDCATIQDEKIKSEVYKIMADILEVGRAQSIYCLITSHLINSNDRKINRVIFNEMHSMIIFPKSGNFYALNYVLKNYFGFKKDNIKFISDINSRWCLIHKNYPNYVLYDYGAFIPQ